MNKLPADVPTTTGILAFIEQIGVGIASVISAIAEPFVQLFGSSM
ncbi:hypothetical protein [Corynebacterium propinquum]|nr:hypothetical protein [Corynebacterium propinquum]MDK4257415.1 hypothetical protein [Corynebacterium propinquum]MDK4281607.1 hypothetical protein [Corynebacterium propinquum]MDK4297804.1 hypothetical protein [Corynebacterium propinquum]